MIWTGLQATVQRDDVQHIQVLALVLVDAPGLNVEQALRINACIGGVREPMGQVSSGCSFDCPPALHMVLASRQPGL